MVPATDRSNPKRQLPCDLSRVQRRLERVAGRSHGAHFLEMKAPQRIFKFRLESRASRDLKSLAPLLEQVVPIVDLSTNSTQNRQLMNYRRSLAARWSIIATLLAFMALPASANNFPTRNINLLSRLGHEDMGSAANFGNDIWGWEDPATGREYALVGQKANTAFVDITDGSNPVYLGSLPSHTGSSTWRDIKVYQDHAFVVSDNNGPHGMQVFDLTRLRGVTSPQNWSSDTVFDSFRSAHNIVINEDSGYAYAVGGNRASGGLHIINIQNPTNPFVAGNFSQDGYTHDAQVVNYLGPDPDYAGSEIAFAANIDTLTIADVTNKSNTQLVSRTGYEMSGYAHQGWLSEDHRYFYMNDEADELDFFQDISGSRTLVWDVSDLDNPVFVGDHQGTKRAIDHNLYVKGDYIYEANYSVGMRVLEVVDPATADLREVAYIDTYDRGDPLGFDGAWSAFPFFDSGKIIINDRFFGLFVVELDFVEVDLDGNGDLDCADIDLLTAAIATGSTDLQFDLNSDGVVSGADRDAWLFEAGAQLMESADGFLPGDANFDGVVDGVDFVVWNTNKFQSSSSWCDGDFNSDGSVNGADFIIWNTHKFADAAAAVPEPSSVAWLIGSILALGIRRRGQA